MSLSPGTRLGHYDVSALIDEGGMGQVYRATRSGSNGSNARPVRSRR